MFPQVKFPKKEVKKTNILFSGLNQNEFTQDGQASSMTNISTSKLPILTTRPPRQVVKTISTPNGYFTAGNGKECYVNGTTFYYDGTIKGIVENSRKYLCEYNGKILIFPDKKYYDYANNLFGSFNATFTSGSSEITFINRTTTSTDDVVFDHNSIILTGSDTWDSDFQTGAVIQVSGCVVNPGNDVQAKITGKSGTTLYFANNTFTPGTETTAITFAFSAIKTSGATNFTDTFNITYDLDVYVQVAGCTAKIENNTFGRLTGISSKILSFTPSTFVANSVAETGAITIKMPTPDNMIAGVSWKNRVFSVGGVNNDEIFCTVYNEFKNWQEYGGTNDPAYAWAWKTQSPGEFTGICTYGNQALCFKPDRVYELYNDNKPFKPIEISKSGCIDGKSICEVKSVLYWLGGDGIYAYSGGTPRLISQNLKETYLGGTAGTDGRRYYLSLKTGTSTYKLYVYDTENGQWSCEDTSNVIDFSFKSGYLYALNSDGILWQYNYGTEVVYSTLIFGVETGGISNKKYLKQLNFRVDLKEGYIKVYTKTDNGDFVQQGSTYTTAGLQPLLISLNPVRCDHYQIKLDIQSLTGQCDIWMVEKVMNVGSDR